jgi:4-hydroxybenzoate polyprenyltransferase
MGFLSAFIRLTRFEHAIMLAIAVLIGETIASGGIPAISTLIILSLLVPIFSEMGSFALNDYLDVNTDKINKREDRPLVTGEINKEFAYWFAIASIIISIVISYYINIYAFAIAVVFNVLAIAYNYRLKDMPLIGNVYIGLTMAIPFLFGSAVVTDSLSFSPTIIVISLLGLMTGTAREIIKSTEDMKGDEKARNSRTLPLVIGERNARLVAAVLYLVSVSIAFIPFYIGLKQNNIAIAIVGIAALGLFYLAYLVSTSWNKKDLKKARKLSLLFLFIGLIGLFFASIA